MKKNILSVITGVSLLAIGLNTTITNSSHEVYAAKKVKVSAKSSQKKWIYSWYKKYKNGVILTAKKNTKLYYVTNSNVKHTVATIRKGQKIVVPVPAIDDIPSALGKQNKYNYVAIDWTVDEGVSYVKIKDFSSTTNETLQKYAKGFDLLQYNGEEPEKSLKMIKSTPVYKVKELGAGPEYYKYKLEKTNKKFKTKKVIKKDVTQIIYNKGNYYYQFADNTAVNAKDVKRVNNPNVD